MGPVCGHAKSTSARAGALRGRAQGESDSQRSIEVSPQNLSHGVASRDDELAGDLPALGIQEPRKRIGVMVAERLPAAGADIDDALAPLPAAHAELSRGQQRTLSALEAAFPVRFEQADPTSACALDGVLMLGAAGAQRLPANIPRLVLADRAVRARRRSNTAGSPRATASSERSRVTLMDCAELARALRGRIIAESELAGARPLDAVASKPLASVDGVPVWCQTGDAEEALSASAYPLAELREGEALREQLRAGRFMGLLPLVHLIAQVLGAGGWTLPPLRASFVIDDPNLHWPSYGYIDYRELAAHALEHGYHVGLATVPLDGWLIDRRVAALLARNASALSLLVHGNNHVTRELGRLERDVEAVPAIAQALRRIAALERRSGLRVERVMAPPHGACSEAAIRAMFRLGMQAACIGCPYPWLEQPPASMPLAEWHPAELVAGGLPVLARHPLSAPREDLALRALLGQPLILYGHHGDFAEGPDVLARAASDLAELGEIGWGPLGWIARGSYSTRRVGDLLLVRMFARRISLEPPPGVRALRVLVQEPFGGAAGHRLSYAGGCADVRFSDGLGVSDEVIVPRPARGAADATPARAMPTGRTRARAGLTLTLAADRPLTPAAVRSRGVRPWPLVRRALVEGRDRIQALR